MTDNLEKLGQRLEAAGYKRFKVDTPNHGAQGDTAPAP